MIESGSGEHYINEDKLRVLAEMVAGKKFVDIAKEVGFTLDQAQALLSLLDRAQIKPSDLRGSEGVVHEKLLPDEYTVPTLSEIFDGGGSTWIPVFSKEKTNDVTEQTSFQQFPEKGLLHVISKRKSLDDLLTKVRVEKDPLAAKELSMRCLEIAILQRRLEENQLTLDDRAFSSFNRGGEGVVDTAEALGLAVSSDGMIDTSDPRKYMIGSLRALQLKIGMKLSEKNASFAKNIFLPHIDAKYAQSFGTYTDAKTAPVLKA